jgi:quinol monooxygenase YgiN
VGEQGLRLSKVSRPPSHIATHRAAKGEAKMRRRNMEIVVMTMNVTGLTHEEFRAILDEMGVEARPEPGIYQHISHPTETGFQIIEIWESQKGFEEFAERRLKPAITKLSIERETTIVFQPLHNLFGPRINELPGLIGHLPREPNT